MKRERLFSCLTAAGLAFFTGLGGAACVATGFQLHVKSWTLVVLAIFAAAVLSALFFSVRRGPAMLLGVLVFLGLLAGKKLELGAESLLFRVSNTFNSAYSSPVIRWTGESPYATPTDLGLCLLALIPVLAVAFTVCRRKTRFLPW